VASAKSAVRDFLAYLGISITTTALSELIRKTGADHRNEDFTTDRKLTAFGKGPPSTNGRYVGYLKAVFEKNDCPLTKASAPPQATKKIKRISAGILKAIYDSLPRDELRLLTDLCTHVPERVQAVCVKTPISAWEDNGRYTVIRFDPEKTKVHYEHIGILPKRLADKIREYTKQTGRYPNAPFPNADTLWQEITKWTTEHYGIHLTSQYCRKEFQAKAKKTQMPPNDWDFLMGHKQKVGNQAHHYDAEDDPTLIHEYDQYLAPYLGLGNTREPDEAETPFRNDELEQLQRENAQLKGQILKLAQLLTQHLGESQNMNTDDAGETDSLSHPLFFYLGPA
jgi:integrase